MRHSETPKAMSIAAAKPFEPITSAPNPCVLNGINRNGRKSSTIGSTNALRDEIQPLFQNFHTPNPPRSSIAPPVMSAPHISSLHHGPVTTPHPHPPHTVNVERHYQNTMPYSASASTQDRVAKLASKLHSMETPAALFQSSSHTNSQTRLHNIQQFISMLQGMQHTVARTADQQQRVRKSQALNLLLNMFEQILEEQNISNTEGNSSIEKMKQTVRQLEEENEQLHNMCKDRDEELSRLHQQLQRMNNEIHELKNEVARAQDECDQERQRAQEAELIAYESESVRNELFASYGQLTEANVELERAIEEVNTEKQALIRDLEYFKEEIAQLENQCHILTQQIKEKDSEMSEMEKKFDTLHSQLASHRHSFEMANTHRHRLQDELHASQRNATSTSQQLLELREQYTRLQKETDAKRRNQLMDESANSNLTLRLQEEQLHRKDLEGQVSKFQSREMAAQEQIRKLARANAELKSRVNEMNARLDNSSIVANFKDECSDSCSALSVTKRGNVAPNLLDCLKLTSG
jgi:chromosome segregation ATPase